ncbi:caveolae-associated protein 1 [Trachemys scripta elegans]|uniref:caveolae-associated protein 1 n=1 Tax=Trachemys scripta elegans TaxID=31138 RepID=UPI001554C346|nr:caveolae-associated protein 1 [Trachemys scripta elegans]
MADTPLQIIEQPAPSETSEEQVAEEPIKSDQINGVMVLTLLDKIIGAVDQIQLTQTQLEERQQEMDSAVASIQGELTKLTKAHTTTSNTVNKMLEKVRKVSVNVKTVRQNLEKQAGQIKKLEVNEAELLKRRNFKVMIYQPEKTLSVPSDPASENPPSDPAPENPPSDPAPKNLPSDPAPENLPWPQPAADLKGGGRFRASEASPEDCVEPLLLKL